MREAHVSHVFGQRLRDVTIGRQAVGFAAPPRAQMHFVDRHRRAKRVVLPATLHPLGIAPVVVERPRARSRRRRRLGEECVGVGLVHRLPGERRSDPVLVGLPARDSRHEALPDAGTVLAHGEYGLARVPAVEVADDRDTFGVRSPHRKRRSGLPRNFAEVTAEGAVEPGVRSFAKQIDVVVGERVIAFRECGARPGIPAGSAEDGVAHGVVGNREPCANSRASARARKGG